jgi:geranylgeranyl pyrophosphate synthase
MMVWQETLGLAGPRRGEAQLRLLSAFTQVLEGQAVELGWYRTEKWDVREGEYFGVVRGKTGALIAASCEVGALLGGADAKTCRALSEFGMGIGVGFQIIDDVLNIFGNEKKYGKEIGGDIHEGKRTLMTIRALNALRGEKHSRLAGLLRKEQKSGGDVECVAGLLWESGAVETTKKTAEQVVKKALKNLGALPESGAKRTLGELAEYIIGRER